MVDSLACLADEGRMKPAIGVGELAKSYDPAVSEWGNPPRSYSRYPIDLSIGGERAELKYLSRHRKRNHRDSLSKR